jgi:Arc/MetJ family transcription regulator
MKRTNLVLDEKLLEETVRLSGEKTYSRAVERAMRDFVKLQSSWAAFQQLAGKGEWEGNLAEMRADRPRRRAR